MQRYSVTVCGSYPGACSWHWGWKEASSADEAAQRVATDLDEAYPDYAPHRATAEQD